MSSSVASMAGGLVALAAIGGAGALGAAIWRRDRDHLAGSLAVALDGPVDPLPAALRLGFAGLEIALRLDDHGDLRTTAGEPEPLFERAILAPLAARMSPPRPGADPAPRPLPLGGPTAPSRRRPAGVETGYLPVGEVYTFQLLLRLAGGDPHEAYAELDGVLAGYSRILTRATGTRITPGPVRVVLVGPRWPRETIVEQDDRLVFLEQGAAATVESRELAPLVTRSLAPLLGWDPREPWSELPAEARHIVRSLVREAHADRRQIRFVDVPDRPRTVRRAFWRELHAAGADYIGSRDLAALARFLRGPLPWVDRPHSHRAAAGAP